MLAGSLLGLVHDRRLMREVQVNIAIRWFVGYGLHEFLPDHSSRTRIRQRWGAERFGKIFARAVQACVAAGIARGEVVHIDATLIRADVSWESLGKQHADAVLAENGDAAGHEDDVEADVKAKAERDGKQTGRHKKICLTDPDGTMATNARHRRLEPADKQHTAVDVFGVILTVDVTTGELNEGDCILPQVDAVAAVTGTAVKAATADQGYAYAKVYGGLERRGIDPVIPAKKEPIRSKSAAASVPLRCPARYLEMSAGAYSAPKRPIKHGRYFYSRARDCKRCPLRADCFLQVASTRRLSSAMTTRPCCVPVDGKSVGLKKMPASIAAIAGDRRVSRRGKDLARARQSGLAWIAKHDNPSVPYRRSDHNLKRLAAAKVITTLPVEA